MANKTAVPLWSMPKIRNYPYNTLEGSPSLKRKESNTMYVYIKSEPTLWTVGFYSPDGEWNSESDYETKELAAERVHYLNGGNNELQA